MQSNSKASKRPKYTEVGDILFQYKLRTLGLEITQLIRMAEIIMKNILMLKGLEMFDIRCSYYFFFIEFFSSNLEVR